MSTASSPSLLTSAWRELRRRKVVRAGAAYAVVAWVVLQIGEITFEPLGLPPRALTWTILGAILGFPVVLVLAWFFDLGPRGITLDRSPAAKVGAWMAVLLVLLTTAGVGTWLAQLYSDAGPATAVASAGDTSIAVLPFADMSPARDQSHLGDGIAEELLDRLARDSRLQVASRTSSFALRDQAHDIKQLGEKLGVRWVVEGSVRKSGQRLRITAQLIDAGSGFHAWSETYERDDSDLFALQDEVTEAIAAQLRQRMQLSGGAIATEQIGETQSAAAREAFLQGRQAWRQRTPASLDRAEQLFRQAVELDPNYARAWAGLADTYLLQVDYGTRTMGDAVQRAEPAAVRAVTLAPALGEAWASVGLLRMGAGQLAPAERSLREAIRLDPRYEMAPMWLASVLGRQGELKQQVDVLRQALEINPLEPVINVNLAHALAQLGSYEEAEQQLQRSLALTPREPLLLRSLAQLHREQGLLAQALDEARQAYRADSSAPATWNVLAQCLIELGDFQQFDQLLSEIDAQGDVVLSLRQLRSLYSEQPVWLPDLRRRLETMSSEELKLQPRLVQLSAWASRFSDPDIGLRLIESVLGDDEPDKLDVELLSLRDGLQQLNRPLSEQRRAFWASRAARADSADQSAGGLYLRAAMYALAGDLKATSSALDQALQAGFSDPRQLRFDPRFEALRRHAKLAEVQAEMERRWQEQRRLAGLADAGE